MFSEMFMGHPPVFILFCVLLEILYTVMALNAMFFMDERMIARIMMRCNLYLMCFSIIVSLL